MKKRMIITAFAAVSAVGLIQSATFADSMPYEPVFESAPITESMTNPPATTISTTKVTPINNVSAPATSTATSVETENLQNALLQLDGAQVEIRNQLIQYRNEYTELDNQYKTLKEKRALKSKQIKETEKRIKNIDAIKEKTRKNMN